jgi:hypothetical protein
MPSVSVQQFRVPEDVVFKTKPEIALDQIR